MHAPAAPETVPVSAGPVTLSDRRTSRTWQVEVAAFEIAAHPLTQREYADVTDAWPGIDDIGLQLARG